MLFNVVWPFSYWRHLFSTCRCPTWCLGKANSDLDIYSLDVDSYISIDNDISYMERAFLSTFYSYAVPRRENIFDLLFLWYHQRTRMNSHLQCTRDSACIVEIKNTLWRRVNVIFSFSCRPVLSIFVAPPSFVVSPFYLPSHYMHSHFSLKEFSVRPLTCPSIYTSVCVSVFEFSMLALLLFLNYKNVGRGISDVRSLGNRSAEIKKPQW